METICKSAAIRKAEEPDGDELDLINAQALRPLAAEEVFLFKLAACDDQVDRDFERFTPHALEQMAKLYVGKPVLRDHSWNSTCQAARVYAAGVEEAGEGRRLVLRCYMPRTQGAAETIAAIESGVIRECSVGLRAQKSVCSVCGADQTKTCCPHIPGREYDGQLCVMELDGAKDAYEVSFVAVPAQPAAGVVKSKRYGGAETPEADGPQGAQAPDDTLLLAQAAQELEEKRYGGKFT